LEQYAGICATLMELSPPLAEALRRQTAAWPKRLRESELFNTAGFAAISANPLLLYLLQSTPVRDLAFERLLTALRLSILTDAVNGKTNGDVVLAFGCVLAKQCFINEFVFATTAEEESQIDHFRSGLAHAIAMGVSIDPMQLAT